MVTELVRADAGAGAGGSRWSDVLVAGLRCSREDGVARWLWNARCISGEFQWWQWWLRELAVVGKGATLGWRKMVVARGAAGREKKVALLFVVAGEVGGGGCHGGWKERRKLGLGFWEMKMMTWQNLIG